MCLLPQDRKIALGEREEYKELNHYLKNKNNLKDTIELLNTLNWTALDKKISFGKEV